jgi:endonuclease/exonuclease/phosphatase family metal-dependent hydrolase
MRPWLAAVAAVLIGTVSAHPDSSPSSPKAISNQPITGFFAMAGISEPSVRVISWNIDRGYHLDRVIDTLRNERPSICLLQEVDLHNRRTGNRDVARTIAETLKYNYAYGIEFEELSQQVNGQPAFHGQATLATAPILASRVLRFVHQSDFWRPHGIIPDIPLFQRRLGGRIALITELSIAGSPVVVYNLHLESRSGGKIQSAQIQEVLEDLKRYPDGAYAIIGGDFNSKYHPARVLRMLERAGFRSVLGRRIERTHVIIGSLDWIFVRGAWSVQDARIMRGTHASDHDEVMADLLRDTRFKKR